MFHDGSQAFCQHGNAALVWVEPVSLAEPRILGDALKKKGVKRHMLGTREIGINPVEGGAVLFPPTARRTHPRQQQSRSARSDFDYHRSQIVANLGRLDSTQRVVRTQFEDYEIRFFGDGAIDPGNAAGGGVTGYSRINYPHCLPLCAQTRFELGWKGRVSRNPEPGGETVSQNEDYYFAGSSGGFSQWPTRYHPKHRGKCERAASEQSGMPVRPGLPGFVFIAHSFLPD
jgi:hypothetical protein